VHVSQTDMACSKRSCCNHGSGQYMLHDLGTVIGSERKVFPLFLKSQEYPLAFSCPGDDSLHCCGFGMSGPVGTRC
jgi:hypothetical protein